MTDSVILSTLVLTALLMVGLFFFIRASTKDRIQQVRLISEQPEESLSNQLRQYFGKRAYRVAAIDAVANQVTFEGKVRPSLFLAVFLSLLAAVGMLCLMLVLSMVLPSGSLFWLGLLLLSPLAGVFYWRGADRVEQVSLKVETVSGGTTDESGSQTMAKTLITVTAHRDELAELQRTLGSTVSS
ncbi:cofactor assembly of complex C subunit B [Myxacorys almedinensis]|uniref:Cofactor assembly of complex C subunit B n=1 Tax=Myxacorys almedinensis A TaxID=2690445 RepID=A0A8J7YZ21_9CYAN|nr:cofactor assembly of complex C subunit B [Myxacorys almedinensis]NDJ17159.1 cofactor assembly of complex C subunit B [Myxacorys almedinensis A]